MKKKQAKMVKKPASLKKDMAVSELAGMVARGFTEARKDLTGKIGGAEERLTARIIGVEHKVDLVRESVNELTFESRKMRTRLENLELKVFGSVQTP